jgi:hypothetical protein
VDATKDSPKGTTIDLGNNAIVANLFANEAAFILHRILPLIVLRQYSQNGSVAGAAIVYAYSQMFIKHVRNMQ